MGYPNKSLTILKIISNNIRIIPKTNYALIQDVLEDQDNLKITYYKTHSKHNPTYIIDQQNNGPGFDANWLHALVHICIYTVMPHIHSKSMI